MLEVKGTPFEYDAAILPLLTEVADRVDTMRQVGKLSPETLKHLFNFFRIKNIYHSNAIEGNQLEQGETRLVVERGLTIAGKPLRDQAEARSLASALEYLEDLAQTDRPVVQADVRQIHKLILTGIDDQEAGRYRAVEVKISGSDYAPSEPREIPREMTEFSDWIRTSTEAPNQNDAILIACAAHAWFAQIHPFIDGNGRTARIMMNLLLMRSRYPIAIITRDERARYYDALEESQVSNLSPFIHLVCESILESLEVYEQAAEEQRLRGEWIQEMASRLGAPERGRRHNEYEVWSRAMELFRARFRVVSESLDDSSSGLYRVYFRDFGNLDFDKYLALSSRQSAKRTWFFRIDVVRQQQSVRHLFFFGFASNRERDDVDVTLHVAREDPAGSFHYEWLRNIELRQRPPFVEVGYSIRRERFVCIRPDSSAYHANIDVIARQCIGNVIGEFDT